MKSPLLKALGLLLALLLPALGLGACKSSDAQSGGSEHPKHSEHPEHPK
jgi:hypothetical protein